MAGSWSLGIVEQSQGEDCRSSGEMDGGDVREEVVVGNVWEMPVEESRQPWKQGNTAESIIGGGAITIASLLPHTSISS